MSKAQRKRRYYPPTRVKTATNAELKRFWNRWVNELEAAHSAMDDELFTRATKQVNKIEKEMKHRGIW